MIEILSLYTAIPNSKKKLFESKVSTRAYKKGDFLLLNDEIQDQLCLVRSGLLMMYFDNGDKRMVIDFAYKNRFAADIQSFSGQTPSEYCIECLEDSVVEQISYDDLQGLFDQSPEIERACRILGEKILGAAVKRQVDLSCLDIEERFRLIVRKRPELFGLAPHKYIASYLNIDPTNFSKLYHRFAKNPIKFY